MAEIVIKRGADAPRQRSLVTPEGVDLSLKLADAGQRFAAFMVDLMIMGGMVLAMILVLVLLFMLVANLGQPGMELVLILGLIGWFLIRSCYFILLEMGPRAATFGKRACGLRVVARSGERLTADRVIVRNLTREIEFFLPLSFLLDGSAQGVSAGWTLAGLVWTGVFAFFPLFNKDRMRVGDLLAGTWVIAAPKKQLSVDLFRYAADSPTGAPAVAAPASRFTEAQLDVYGAYELQTLERVLREGHYDKIATVADAIRAKLDLPYDGEEDYLFLRAYYDASRTRMERALLFGKRRADKHDR
ncbi:MAG TPA: RDD family protein [Allosphingosinicella sp.]|nr:RDD family protein [Allosphingosinicella sp.]